MKIPQDVWYIPELVRQRIVLFIRNTFRSIVYHGTWKFLREKYEILATFGRVEVIYFEKS